MPYLWGAGIQGKAASGNEIDVPFGDLINNLNMTFMGNMEARKSKWSLATDVIYLNVGAKDGGQMPVAAAPGISVSANADIKLRSWVLTFTGGYNRLQSQRATLDLVAGARYLEIDALLRLSTRVGRFGRTGEANESGAGWDAIVGVKGDVGLNDDWYVPYYLDIGTGDSDFTWQVATAVSATDSTGETSTSSTAIMGLGLRIEQRPRQPQPQRTPVGAKFRF